MIDNLLKVMKIHRPKSMQPIPRSAKKVFAGVFFNVYQWQQKLYDGSIATFEKLSRADTVNVLPVTDQGKIILTRQKQPRTQPFIGSIGGIIDPGETPEQAARRELLEETGLQASDLKLLDARQLTSIIDWVSFIFVAKKLTQASRPHLDAGEKIEVLEYGFEEFLDVIASRDYRDNEIALLFLKAKQLGRLEKLRKLLR